MSQNQGKSLRRLKSPSRVGISTATKGTIREETALWRMQAFVQLAPNVEIIPCITSLPLEHARNEQVERFLASTCTHLFLLDSDCVPQDRTIQQLLAYDMPIIAAPHPTRKGDEIGLMVLDRQGDSYVQHRPLTGIQGPDVVVGCAGLLIRRDVLEKLGPFRFLYDERGMLTKGEDFDFCDRAHDAGYEVWAQCDLAQQHIVTMGI